VLPDFLTRGNNTRLWTWALLGTALFALWFGATVDWETLSGALADAGLKVIAAALVLLILNGLLAIAWLSVITRRNNISGAFEVIGWQFLAATLLPARLSDVAWMYLIHKKLNIAPGRAVFIALYHRLLDFVVASLFFLVSVLALGSGLLGAHTELLAALVFAILIAIVASLEFFLTLGARILQWFERHTDKRLAHILLGQLLHVRVWYRHGLPKSLLWLTFAIIVARWVAILAALGILIHAMAAPLGWTDSAFLSNVYIYFSIIPLQTIGGFGAGEAGLAWVLTLYGLTLGKASAIALLIRMLINLLHIGFWAVTAVSLAAIDSFRKQASL